MTLIFSWHKVLNFFLHLVNNFLSTKFGISHMTNQGFFTIKNPFLHVVPVAASYFLLTPPHAVDWLQSQSAWGYSHFSLVMQAFKDLIALAASWIVLLVLLFI